jgi:hypothetical protein
MAVKKGEPVKVSLPDGKTCIDRAAEYKEGDGQVTVRLCNGEVYKAARKENQQGTVWCEVSCGNKTLTFYLYDREWVAFQAPLSPCPPIV